MTVVLGLAAAGTGWLPPVPALLGGAVLMVAGITLSGASESVPVWIAALVLAALGLGMADTSAIGILVGTAGTDRIVLAMVVASQAFALGYLAGPAVGGAVAQTLGFRAIGLVPLAAGILVAAALLRTGLETAERRSAG